MTEIETKDLVSFDELLTPRIVPFVFWTLEIVNILFWIAILVPRATSEAVGVLDPQTGQFSEGGTDYHWGTIVFCFIMMLVGALLARVACDLLLCIFRWQASTRGILMAMTGAPAPMALAQGGPDAPAAAAATARVAAPSAAAAAVSTQPPWEQPGPAQAAPVPAPPAQAAPAQAAPAQAAPTQAAPPQTVPTPAAPAQAPGAPPQQPPAQTPAPPAPQA